MDSKLSLLTIPLELRTEIYGYLPLFSLLQLSQTCSSIRTDLLSFPRILRSAYGQRNRVVLEGPALAKSSALLDQLSARYITSHTDSLTPATPTAAHNIPLLSIENVERLQGDEELELFNKRYGRTRVGGRRVWACEKCFGVLQGEADGRICIMCPYTPWATSPREGQVLSHFDTGNPAPTDYMETIRELAAFAWRSSYTELK
ncbi:hypothetical protein BJ508DRAFT_419594 [Ascobolus immersus RN42]|uniref:F-box domain-containing protein n=1 Tax=Ascobolus immersus RN42 TaxID=1160509 RepID=A0A3N4HD43_ASCIM|nr:hypothetical protein BJ508DRAFT_419594 [Ascobolus immersus RN42]